MWGWFDNLDTDNNPCDPNNSDTAEWHDLNQNDLRDDGDEELHCVRPGRYRLDLLDGGVVIRSRTVDHLRTTSTTLNGKVIEEPGQGQANDTFLHTELTASVSVSNNVLAIDNPQTDEAFAPSDTVVMTSVRVRFDSRATTSWDGDPRGPLMNRVYFDRAEDLNDRTGYWNPDLVIRTNAYDDTRSFKTATEIATPKDPTGDSNRLSTQRTIIVTGDAAEATGNTFPSSMSAGGVASVSLTMKNVGTTTWSGGSGYKLVLTRHAAAWFPTSRSLSGSVSPGSSQTFAFDLRHIEPELTGTIACFYQMEHSALRFGEENGRDIFVSSKTSSSAVSDPLTAVLGFDPQESWTKGAVDGGTSPLVLDASVLEEGGVAALEYTYWHAVPRRLDVVLEFAFDPAVLEPLIPVAGDGAAGLERTFGLAAPGEYWVRLTGTVPAGQGLILAFPFRLLPGAKMTPDLGTLTLYYPGS